jgi:hypothetical protein
VSAVRSLKNQYRGINAHLHSLLQSEGGWNSFHTSHITHLMTVMKAQLRPLGYTADLEQSLQIRRYDEPAGKPESDVSIYDLDAGRSSQPAEHRHPLNTDTLVLSIPQALGLSEKSFKTYSAVAIYQAAPGQRGKPVAWVELLSPSNKPGGQDADEYREKRLKILQSGVVLVEIDYLNESGPTLDRVPDYRQRETDAHPYSISVIDPRPVFIEGLAYIRGFDVDEPIPTLIVPLNGEDKLPFDFGIPYTKTFEEAFYGDNVDYRTRPAHFERYRPSDQARIAARMLAVLEAAQAGTSLDDAALPVRDIPLDEALARIQAISAGGQIE